MTVAGLFVDWMLSFPPDEVSPLPYVPPSRLPLPHWFDPAKWPHLAAPELINAVYRCQRCGMCRETKSCAVLRKNLPLEIYTPRAIIATARALLEERMSTQALPAWFTKALQDCNCCGRCGDACIVNVAYREGASPEPNIDHARLFKAIKETIFGASR
ncbi:MAG: 4Fe-4S dicluster domain-containing protein [Chloroflexi bacterium]|nr:4Fe-4S dicluster domain-containing protein [Chloroflexota bacterium]MDA8189192.1 4Fe-4S dicluster domain-containing protein [Dehalococcoidales bacterium]